MLILRKLITYEYIKEYIKDIVARDAKGTKINMVMQLAKYEF